MRGRGDFQESFFHPNEYKKDIGSFLGPHIKGRITKKISEIIRQRGVKEGMEYWLKALGVKPVFERAENQDFTEMRHRLHTEPGVVIANHPGWFDMPIILSSANRDDAKIVIKQSSFESYAQTFGTEYFLPAIKNGKGAMETVNAARQHIKNGGLVIIFPSAGIEHKKGLSAMEFHAGFRHILKGVDPQTMVYSFNFNYQDAQNIHEEKLSKLIGLGSDADLGSWANINRLGAPSKLLVDENYSKAGEWQQVIRGLSVEDADAELTSEYFHRFKF